MIWIFLSLLEIFFVIQFLRLDRGYFGDMYHREICVTEVIPITRIYGRKFIADIKNGTDRITGIELEVKNDLAKRVRFLLFKDVSEYWNCFPTYANMHWRFRGTFEPGEHKLQAVRLYYLKYSRIVVKVDVILV